CWIRLGVRGGGNSEGVGAILGSQRRICRRISRARILPPNGRASMHLVDLRRLRRLACAWWKTCARSRQRTKSKSRTTAMKTFFALAFLAATLTSAAAQTQNFYDARGNKIGSSPPIGHNTNFYDEHR